MAREGIAVETRSQPNFGQDTENGFDLRLSRGKGTVLLTVFFFNQEKRYILGFAWGRNPFRWYWDAKLDEIVKGLLKDEGMYRTR